MPNPRTAALAEAIVASRPDTDPAAMRAARIALVDFLACALAGSTDPSLTTLRGVFGDAPGRALVIGSAQPADPFLAALSTAMPATCSITTTCMPACAATPRR